MYYTVNLLYAVDVACGSHGGKYSDAKYMHIQIEMLAIRSEIHKEVPKREAVKRRTNRDFHQLLRRELKLGVQDTYTSDICA